LNSFITRTISGFFFVVILISCIYFYHTLLFSLLALLSFIGVYECNQLLKKTKNQFNWVFSFIPSIIFFLLITLSWKYTVDLKYYSLLILPFFLLLIFTLFSKVENPLNYVSSSFFGFLYVAIPFWCLYQLGFLSNSVTNEYSPNIILGFFFVMWANDTGAYLTGKAFGKHKFFPRISPNKTWEGTIGGIVIGVIIAYYNHFWFENLNVVNWIVVGFIITIFGTLGDLVESMFKRAAKVKDSGKIMPGHGGVLDRFDSTLLAAPMVWLYLLLLG
jgi:phosphatidate cytidylyltransferase